MPFHELILISVPASGQPVGRPRAAATPLRPLGPHMPTLHLLLLYGQRVLAKQGVSNSVLKPDGGVGVPNGKTKDVLAKAYDDSISGDATKVPNAEMVVPTTTRAVTMAVILTQRGYIVCWRGSSSMRWWRRLAPPRASCSSISMT